MAFGDLEARYVLDDKGFRRGLRGVESAAREHEGRIKDTGERMGDGFYRKIGSAAAIGVGVFEGIRRSVDVAAMAVKAYGDLIGESEQAMAQMHAAATRQLEDIGRGFAGLGISMQSASGFYGGLLKFIQKLRDGTQAALLLGMTGSVSETKAAMAGSHAGAANEEAQRTLDLRQKQTAELIKQQEMRTIEASGDQSAIERARIRVNLEERMAAASASANEVNTARLTGLIQEEARLRENAIRDREQKAYIAEQEKKAIAEERVGFDMESYRIDTLRLQGHAKEADIARERLELEKRISALSHDEALSEEARANAIEQARAATEDRISILERGEVKDSGGASISAGLGRGGTGVLAQLFGGGGNSVQGQLKRGQDRMVAYLGEIAKNTRSTTAVYA